MKKGGNCFMMNGKLVKVIGFAATLVGMGATIVSNWVNDKNLDAKVDSKVTEALAQYLKEKES
jgi:hypothetical protein